MENYEFSAALGNIIEVAGTKYVAISDVGSFKGCHACSLRSLKANCINVCSNVIDCSENDTSFVEYGSNMIVKIDKPYSRHITVIYAHPGNTLKHGRTTYKCVTNKDGENSCEVCVLKDKITCNRADECVINNTHWIVDNIK